MATIKRGILGGFTGKVGSVIGSSWKGIETMRSMPISVLNPRTTAQINNRNRFKSVAFIASQMLTQLIKPLNDRFAQGMSGYNVFCSRNRNVFNAAGVFQGALMKLSVGKLSPAVIASVDSATGSQINVQFPTAPIGSFDSGEDFVYACILSPDGDLLGQSTGDFQRKDGLAQIICNNGPYPTATLHCYLAFKRNDGSMVSNSAYSSIDA